MPDNARLSTGLPTPVPLIAPVSVYFQLPLERAPLPPGLRVLHLGHERRQTRPMVTARQLRRPGQVRGPLHPRGDALRVAGGRHHRHQGPVRRGCPRPGLEGEAARLARDFLFPCPGLTLDLSANNAKGLIQRVGTGDGQGAGGREILKLLSKFRFAYFRIKHRA
jgi:hypothetical protein